MKNRPEILDGIMFLILERAKCEVDTENYLEHVVDYCKKGYKKQKGIELTIDEIQYKYDNQRKK